SRRRHTRWPRDWSSDVCSSDLCEPKEHRIEKRFLLVSGVDFYFQVSFMNQRPASYSVQEAFFNSVFFWFAFVLIFPLITMRLFRSEERRVGKWCRFLWSRCCCC